jgi:D-alanyl-D-alanine carboxypeptidase
MAIDSAKLTSRLAVVLDSLLSHWPLPGGVVAIVDNDEVLLVHPFGYADLGARTPVRPEHLFEIGSISKVFTSLVINQLIDEGAFELDTPIVSLVP